jgi:hypothetical protein
MIQTQGEHTLDTVYAGQDRRPRDEFDSTGHSSSGNTGRAAFIAFAVLPVPTTCPTPSDFRDERHTPPHVQASPPTRHGVFCSEPSRPPHRRNPKARRPKVQSMCIGFIAAVYIGFERQTEERTSSSSKPRSLQHSSSSVSSAFTESAWVPVAGYAARGAKDFWQHRTQSSQLPAGGHRSAPRSTSSWSRSLPLRSSPCCPSTNRRLRDDHATHIDDSTCARYQA